MSDWKENVQNTCVRKIFSGLRKIKTYNWSLQASNGQKQLLLFAGGLRGKRLESSWICDISQCWLLSVGRPPQLQSWIRWTQAHLYSHFLVWIEHPLLHHNYYIQSSSWLTAEPSQGFYCRAVPIFMKFLQRVCAAQRLTDMWAHIHQTSQNSSAGGRRHQISWPACFLCETLDWWIAFVDWLWVRTEPSVMPMQLPVATKFTADVTWFFTAFIVFAIFAHCDSSITV